MRKTKIVATIGPSSQDAAVLESMVEAGLDVVRLNFSHGAFAEHQQVVERIRGIAKKLEKQVGIIVDLQGPKIRIGKFKTGHIQLVAGQKFMIDHHFPQDQGDQEHVSVDYQNLAEDVREGDFLLLNDGLISVEVEEIRELGLSLAVWWAVS